MTICALKSNAQTSKNFIIKKKTLVKIGNNIATLNVQRQKT